MYSFVYITAPNQREAERMAEILVSERLAACANIYPEIGSIYWWKGKMERERESVLIAKTRQDLVRRLINRVKEIHPYECPCIVTFEIKDGYRPFLDWIAQETVY
jgi:periplasmic divalent cation tolerance protein